MERRLVLGLGILLAVLVGWLVFTGERVENRSVQRARGDRTIQPPAEALADPRDQRDGRQDSREGDSLVRAFIHDSDERPIAGARVRLFEDAATAEALTDDQGRCELPAGSCATLELEVTAPGFVGLRGVFLWQQRVELELVRCGVLAGKVRDASNGRPVAGARVHVGRVRRWIPLVEDAVADAEGAFRLECVPLSEHLWIHASAAGYPELGGSAEALGWRRSGEIEIRLRAGPSVEVQVLEFPDDAPIANADVNGSCTDAAGLVCVARDGDLRDPFAFGIEADGFCAVFGVVSPDDLPGSSPLVVRLPPVARLEGIVSDQDGRPVAGATLFFEFEEMPEGNPGLPALPQQWNYDCVDLEMAESDARGRYLSPSLLPGSPRVEVTVEHPEAGELTTTAGPLGAPGETTRLDLTLIRPIERITGTVEGRVRFNGRWIPATVGWRQGPKGDAADIDIEGSYRLERVEVGTVDLKVKSPRLQREQGFLPGLEAHVSVEADRTTRHDFDLVLPVADVAGRVKFEDGRAAEDIEITVVHGDPEYQNGCKTVRDGAWSLSVPDLGWEYEVELRHGQETMRASGVRAGQGNVDFVLPVLPELALRVLDRETGLAVGSCRILWRPSGEGEFRAAAVLREPSAATPDQRLVLKVRPGEIDLLVQAFELGYAPAEVDGVQVGVDERRETLEVRLGRGLELDLQWARGVVPPPDEVVIFLLDEESWDSVRPGDGDGRALFHRTLRFELGRYARLRALAPGEYRFKAFPEGIVIEPETVTLPHEGLLEIRWRRE